MLAFSQKNSWLSNTMVFMLIKFDNNLGPGKASFKTVWRKKFSEFMKSFYSFVETCSHICDCYFENPYWIGYTSEVFLADKLLGTGRTCYCNVRNLIEAT